MNAVVVLAGAVAMSGVTAGVSQAADGTPIPVASEQQCRDWAKALESQGKIKGYHCDNMNDQHQWYLTPVY
ncbi:hypothetical protein [Streptomyces sp. NPDC048516]|uniref:hypothetical protein n=1 Tax=Streptomyces sp. NPDC048516 TaxID=3365565 RepID=UPI0037103915